MIKKMLVGIVLLAILVSPNTAMSNGWGPFFGGVLAGAIISNVYNNCYGYECGPRGVGCCRPRLGGGGYVQRSKVWIPGGLQLQCTKGFYNCWDNFVPPSCWRVQVEGHWEWR